MFWKKKREEEVEEPIKKVNPLFKKRGRLSCRESVLEAWKNIPLVFSLRHLTKTVHEISGAYYLDSTVSRKMRLLRSQNKIDFHVQDMQLSSYRKLF
jgi:hypothetical protein